MKSEENLISSIYNVLKQMKNILSPTLLEYVLKSTTNKLNTLQISGNQLDSLFEFTKLSCSQVPAKQLQLIINNYKKDLKVLKPNLLYFISIIACACEEENNFIKIALDDLSSSKDEQEIKNALILIGDIC